MRLLDRYLLRDLSRTLLICVSILVTVIAFGAAIKPLANDQLLTAWQVAKYIGLAIVPMMQFALPFSAGFAATLTLHRMTADNEIQAMSVSGVSHARVLRPVALLGGGLLVLMLLLTQTIIPTFWGLMQQAISTDVTRIFEASISRGEPFQVDDLLLYADDLAIRDNPDDTDADTRMTLVGFVAAELDAEGRIETEITARQAVVDIHRRGGDTQLMLAMFDTVVFDRDGMQLSRTERVRPEAAWTIRRLRDDEPRAMTRFRLLELLRRPDEFGKVAEARDDLADFVRVQTSMAFIADLLAQTGELEFVERDEQPRRYVVRADHLRGRMLTRDGGDVEVTAFDGGVPVLRFRVGRVELSRSGTRLSQATLGLLLEDYEVDDLLTGVTNRRAQLALPGLLVAGVPADDPTPEPSAALLERVASLPSSPGLQQRVGRLELKLDKLQDEVRGYLHGRYALCLTAPLLLLLGATLAMWLRGSLPLTVYCWAFLPSILDLVLISSGQQIVRDGKAAGVLVLWSGNAVMAVVLAFAFLRLSRH